MYTVWPQMGYETELPDRTKVTALAWSIQICKAETGTVQYCIYGPARVHITGGSRSRDEPSRGQVLYCTVLYLNYSSVLLFSCFTYSVQ
jgi:hypothetical protein